MGRFYSRTVIFNAAANRFRERPRRSNQYRAASARRLRHSLNCIDGKVYDYLLKLDAVAKNWREVRSQIERNGDVFRLKFVTEEYDGLLDNIIESKRRVSRCVVCSRR